MGEVGLVVGDQLVTLPVGPIVGDDVVVVGVFVAYVGLFVGLVGDFVGDIEGL